jgi:uncharacterized membrane protein YecN with MAPEG domain
MKPEMTSLVLASTFTGLLWMPYMLNRIAVRGIASTVGYPVDPPPLAPWAQRLRAAHANAVENLVVFAALVLAAQVLSISTPVTVLAGSLYLWSRVAHAVIYTLGVPWLRTLAFVGGFAAQMLVAWQLLGA